MLYCRPGCAACRGLARQLARGGVVVHVRDVTSDPAAFDDVLSLGYRSLPVLVGSDGSSAAAAGAISLAHRLAGAQGVGESHSSHPQIDRQELR